MMAREFQILMSRRAVLIAGAIMTVVRIQAATGQQVVTYSLPIGWPDRVPGDGFWIRHGYACENTWYNPGWWHTGEDWYALDGEETAGAAIYAVADGQVVFVGSEYPGRVVIVEHLNGLFSMYGHLDHEVLVSEEESVTRGQQLGEVFQRTDGNAPSHLHFEIRDFLFNDRINGSSPEHGVTCGLQCAPGPGYWPMSAPEHPSQLGWRNPSHVIAAGAGESVNTSELFVVVAPQAPDSIQLQSSPLVDGPDDPVIEMPLKAGAQFHLLDVWAGEVDGDGTSAEAYSVWYQLVAIDEFAGWVPALRATTEETGTDGRASALRFDFLIIR